MRIIHTGDWHLGKNLEGMSRLEEQAEFLEDFSVPVKTLEQAIADGERHFIIASEAFEYELKTRIKQLLPSVPSLVIGMSDIVQMMAQPKDEIR